MAIAFILKGYPRLSESFIAQEILGLERRGVDIHIISLRHPTGDQQHQVHREIKAPILYLPEYLREEPTRVIQAWQQARQLAGFTKALQCWLADMRRDFTSNRIRRFGQACVLATELPREITSLHAHFLHTPASVARYTATMMGLSWTCSAHAKDIWTSPEWEIREKLEDLDWLVTCTGHGAEHLRSLAPDPAKVELVYHGLDLTRFAPLSEAQQPRNSEDQTVTILSIGRAVAKKGFDDLLTALASLPKDTQWRFVHIGDGECLPGLKKRTICLGLDRRVHWLGSQVQDKILEHLRSADLFVLASKVAPNGDRDGIPNVLMEAQSQSLPVVSTRVSAIPELIEDGKTGLLVEPGNPRELMEAISQLVSNPDLRQCLGSEGAARLRTSFNAESGLDYLATRFVNKDIVPPCTSRSTHP